MGATKKMLRVARAYAALERVEQAEWFRLEAARNRFEEAATCTRESMMELETSAKRCLGESEIEPWRMVKAEQELLSWRGAALQALLEEHRVACLQARTRYAESRKRTGQIESLVKAATYEEQIQRDRRRQHEADDAFLSRGQGKDRVSSW